jgi:hypothetical protein
MAEKLVLSVRFAKVKHRGGRCGSCGKLKFLGSDFLGNFGKIEFEIH